MCFSPEALATILWNGLVSNWALMVSLARWEMTARQHRGGLARPDITNGERRYLKDRNHFAFEVFKCKQSLFNPTQSTSGTIDVQGILQIAFGEEKNALEPFVGADSLICDRSVVCMRICKFATKTLFCKCATTCYFPKQLLLKYFCSDLGCMLFNVTFATLKYHLLKSITTK